MRISTLLFVVVALFAVGVVWGVSMPTNASGAFSEQTEAFRQLAEFIGNLPVGLMFGFILLKNISAVLFSFVLSPIVLIVPIVSLVMNGWLIGTVSNAVVAERSLGYLLAGILPHGVFELPALLIGEAAAMSFGIAAMQAVFDRSRREQLTITMRLDLKYLAFSLCLLVPAALMEVFVTPALLLRSG